MSQKKSLSRSELVRRRRQEKSRRQAEPRGPSPFVRKTKAKSRYRELPPITARGVVNDFAIERRKKAGKRRFNAAISLPRPKLRALPLPRIHIRVGWRLLSFTLVLLFGGALYLFWSLPEFRVSAAQVTGNQRIPTDEINNALGLNGYPIFLLPPDQVRARALRSFPELASVKVTISLPNIVTVQVTERQPLIQWQQGSGYTWIDETGAAFRPRGEAQGLIVVQTLGSPPVMSAPEDDPLAAPPFIPQETVQALKALAPHVPPGTPIMYDPLTGLSWTDGRGWQAILGTSAEDMEAKVLVYQTMVDWLTQRGIRPTLINVAYSNAPFYHVEQVEEPAQDQVDAETVSEEQ
jgi:hypothetical protein